jgi:pSer/pThr/pTyr-binding forkhead associated (FHA) protein/tetratricopeptide (TPR) repeat protein
MDGEEDGGFGASHTTVDPNLLDRLMALDGKEGDGAAAPAAKPAALERRDKTVTLDLNDLELLVGDDDPEEADAEEVEVGQVEAVEEVEDFDEVEEIEEIDDLEEMEVQPERTQAISQEEISAAFDRKAPQDRNEIAAPRAGTGEVAPVVAEPVLGAQEGPSIEIDQEFSDEKTQIFISAMEDEPTRAKLKVIQGGGQQKEYLLARDRVTIGRGTNNDILVPDIAISRQHCEIKRLPGGTFRLGDLQSGNGTKLNGVRVQDSDLLGGDRIEVGSTILEFVVTGPGASRKPGERNINYHPSESKPAQPARPAPARPVAPAAPVPNYSAGAGAGNATMTHFQVQAVQAQRASNTLVTVLIAGLGVIFLALAGLIGTTIFLSSQKDTDQPVVNKPASDYYFEGVEHVKAQDWDKAEEKFTIATDLAKDERDFQIRKDAELQLERVRKEKNNQKALNRGKSLINQGDYVEAITRLESVRSGSAYYKEARDLIPQAREKYADQLVQQGNKDFAREDYEEAERKALLALKARPDFAGAKELQDKIDALPDESKPKKPVVVATRDPRPNTGGGARSNTRAPRDDEPMGLVPSSNNTKQAKQADKPPAQDNKASAQAGGSQDTKASAQTGGAQDTKASGGGGGGVVDLTPGLGMYRNKRFSEAAAFFKKVSSQDSSFLGQKAGTLAKNVQSFETYYNQGNQAFAGNNYNGAVTPLTRAYRLDKKISGSGYHGRELRKKLAEVHYQQARAAFNGNNNARAGANAKKALGYDKSHSGNRQLLQQLESKGKSMYIDAFNKKTSDPQQAKRIARTIVAMLPENSDTHKKAQRLIKEL